jgi:methionine-rich copper-binding protein CopC
VNFSEAMDAATVNGATVELRDPSSAPVSATVSYDVVSFTATLDPTKSLSPGVTYTARVRGGSADPRVKDLAGNPLAADVTWTFITAPPPDTTPPTVTSFAPANGADNQSIDTNVTVTFSEAMDAATVNGSTVELRDPSNALVSATVSYNAASLTATLDPNAPLSPGVIYTALVRGGSTDPRVKDEAGNALAADVTWTFTIALPPQVVSTTPAPGATNDSIGVAPTATFSEALDEMTLDATTVLLTDADTNPVPFTISYDASAFRVTLTPQQLLQRGQTYTVTLKGGPAAPHITDATGTPLADDFVWSFTTAFSIWAPTEGPAGDPPVANEPGVAIELGLKFRSERDGLITGVRFYKVGPANSGVHVGHLWNSAGTLLGSVSFANETGSGWQQVLFENPIPIAANTTYIVSYFAPEGNYAATGGQFASSGVYNPPLHALMNGVDGGNGVFRNGGGFPNGTFNSTNYWVDVVFNDSGPLPPQVLSVTPARDATNVPTDIEPAATFSEPLAPGSVNGLTVVLTDEENNQVPVTISYEASDFKVRIIPQQPLQLGQTYTVTLKGAPDAPHITDATGTPLAADYTWSFTTESPPASTQVTMLSNWVTAGANFIAMRPDKHLAYPLRIGDESSVLSEAYLQVDTTREPGAGLVIKRLAVESVRLP